MWVGIAILDLCSPARITRKNYTYKRLMKASVRCHTLFIKLDLAFDE